MQLLGAVQLHPEQQDGGWGPSHNNDTPVKVIWSQEAKSDTSEPAMIKKVKLDTINTTQKEAEEFRKNNNNNPGDDGNGGNFV